VAVKLPPIEEFPHPISIIRIGDYLKNVFMFYFSGRVNINGYIDKWEFGISLMMEFSMLFPENSIIGNHSILDCENFHSDHFFSIIKHPIQMRHANSISNLYPIRVNQIHIINSGKFFIKLFRMLSVFMKKKIRERVLVYENLEDLYKNVPKSALPNYLGGTRGDYDEMVDRYTEFTYQNREKIWNPSLFEKNT
ncbi:MAG: hypothetical protein MHPSP_001328, partial [Paramarteilia canceri]